MRDESSPEGLVDKLVNNFGEDKPLRFNAVYYLSLVSAGLLGGSFLPILFYKVDR